jgi:hypothetical protein
MYGSVTPTPTGSPSASKPSQRTGASGCSSPAVTHAPSSVFDQPLRAEIAARSKRRWRRGAVPGG